MPNIFKQPFSYKLDIHIEPQWYNIYKKICASKLENGWEKTIEQKIKNAEENSTQLWGRRYYFTEYYDSVSGLKTKFQRVICENGKEYFYPVDEFGEGGYMFGLGKGYKGKKSERVKTFIEIGENFIQNNIDDSFEKRNYLFNFPLDEVFNFLFALGQRFYGTERKTVVKWPDHIENKFEEAGIKYETQFEFEPTLFEIEKHDKEFFEEWGKPKISLYSESMSEGVYFDTKDGELFSSGYGVSLKMFRSGENDRICELPHRTN